MGTFCEKNIYLILLFSLIFSVFELLRGNLLTGFPWNLISYTWSWSTEFIQILSLIGAYSLSLISITFFVLLFFFSKKNIKKKYFFAIFLLAIFINCNYIMGYIKINNSNYDFDEKY